MSNLVWNGTPFTTINGIPAQQNELAAPLWEVFLRMERTKYAIIEIGTGTGGLTRHLAQFADSVCTYDAVNRWHSDGKIPMCNGNPIHRRVMDVFSPTGRQTLAMDIESAHELGKRVLLLCDGGDKPRELRELAKYLNSKDVIAVHDYRDEGHANGWKDWGWAECNHTDIYKGFKASQKTGIRCDLPFDQAAWGVWSIL